MKGPPHSEKGPLMRKNPSHGKQIFHVHTLAHSPAGAHDTVHIWGQHHSIRRTGHIRVKHYSMSIVYYYQLHNIILLLILTNTTALIFVFSNVSSQIIAVNVENTDSSQNQKTLKLSENIELFFNAEEVCATRYTIHLLNVLKTVQK